MTGVAASMQQRRAALLVQAMHARDRAWLLAALPAPQREALSVLLAELDGLGLRADPTLLDTLRADPAADPLDGWGEREAAALVQHLHAEPAALAQRLLAMRNWPWRTLVAQGLGVAVPAPGSVARGEALDRSVRRHAQHAVATLGPRQERRPWTALQGWTPWQR